MIKHYKSKEGYRKFLAYEHMRTPKGLPVAGHAGRKSIAEVHPKRTKVVIAGHAHKVHHGLHHHL